MTLYDFLLQLGFWQWVGVLMLAAIVSNGVADVISSIVLRFGRKP